MHHIMCEKDVADSEHCIYCGGTVRKGHKWEDNKQYIHVSCSGCKKSFSVKVDTPPIKDGEKDIDSIEARIKVLEYWNQER